MYLTVLHNRNGTFNKSFSATELEDYNPKYNVFCRDYDNVFKINIQQFGFDDLDELYELLDILRGEESKTVIRGSSITGGEQFDVRRLENCIHDEEEISIVDAPQHWVMLDFDIKVELPSDIEQHEIPEFILQTEIPKEFRDVSYISQYSGSAGLSHWCKIHYWFLLTKPLTCKELQRWQKENLQLDGSAFKAAQPLYTADPTFVGLEDPVKQRLMIVKKDLETVEIIVPEEVIHVPGVTTTVTSEGKGGWRRFLDNMTANGAHDQTKSAACSFHAIHGTEADWNYFKNAVLQRMQAVGHPRANMATVNKEVDELIRYTSRSTSYNLPMTSDKLIVKDIIKQGRELYENKQ